jgi:TolA-binding protein
MSMNKKNYFMSLLLILPLVESCNIDFKSIEKKAAKMNHYEEVSLKLARENRELHAEVKRLEFEVEKLKQDTAFYEAKNGKSNGHQTNKHESEHGEVATVAGHESNHAATHEPTREIASIPNHSEVPHESKGEKDFVEFKTYKWRAEDMQQIADKEFKEKHFEKAAQFYTSLMKNYPHFKGLNDEFYFKAGIAAFESGSHHDWTLTHFETLMAKYPTSQYFRSAKLWVALTNLKLGDKKKFFATVEEFRKKYRNTNEWKILSSYYENIEEKTHE